MRLRKKICLSFIHRPLCPEESDGHGHGYIWYCFQCEGKNDKATEISTVTGPCGLIFAICTVSIATRLGQQCEGKDTVISRSFVLSLSDGPETNFVPESAIHIAEQVCIAEAPCCPIQISQMDLTAFILSFMAFLS